MGKPVEKYVICSTSRNAGHRLTIVSEMVSSKETYEVSMKSLVQRCYLVGFPQKQWHSILPAVVFALNTTESSSTKCTPYYVVFGRKPVTLQDLLFDHPAALGEQEAQSVSEYAAELKVRLSEVYKHVAMQLNLTRQQMQQQYNKNICFQNYHAVEKVWLRTKYSKTGENKKLSQRRNGPWTVIKCLPTGLNLRIQND